MNNSIAQELGQRCRRFRNALNISQQALADLIGTTPQNVSKLERDGIYNIETIQEISRVLGHDLLSDEIDMEGSVGEIGKEILLLLIDGFGSSDSTSFQGCIDIDLCFHSNAFWGLTVDRITKEIFKLEKIGLCVREQFEDLHGNRQDWLFITAKGVMTVKHICSYYFAEDDKLNKVKTYEMICGNCSSFQEKLNANEALKILVSIDGDSGFRINFIQFLRAKYEQEAIDFTDRNHFLPYFPGEDCFYDLIYSMATGMNRRKADMFLNETYHSRRDEEIRILEEQLHIDDEFLSKFERKFSRDVVEIDDHGDNPAFVKEIDVPEELGKLYDEELTAWFSNSKSPIDRYNREAQNRDSSNPLDWYSKEDIEKFISDNILPASNDYEKEIDAKIKKIIEIDPSAMNYFSSPYVWEENGIAELIRSKYGY